MKLNYNHIFGGGCPICKYDNSIINIGSFFKWRLKCTNCGSTFTKYYSKYKLVEGNSEYLGKELSGAEWINIRRGILGEKLGGGLRIRIGCKRHFLSSKTSGIDLIVYSSRTKTESYRAFAIPFPDENETEKIENTCQLCGDKVKIRIERIGWKKTKLVFSMIFVILSSLWFYILQDGPFLFETLILSGFLALICTLICYWVIFTGWAIHGKNFIKVSANDQLHFAVLEGAHIYIQD